MANKNGRRDPEKERFWRAVIERQQSSGMSIREFCESKGLKVIEHVRWKYACQTCQEHVAVAPPAPPKRRGKTPNHATSTWPESRAWSS
jgi:hypothetical protein